MLRVAKLSWVGALRRAIYILRQCVLADYSTDSQANLIKTAIPLKSLSVIKKWIYHFVAHNATAV